MLSGTIISKAVRSERIPVESQSSDYLMRNIYIYNACIHIFNILMTGEDSAAVWTDCPRGYS